VYRENAQDLYTHDREVAVYQHLFPTLREIRKQIGLEDDQVTLNVPAPYYLRLEDGANGKTKSSTLIMEDLKWSGFQQQQAAKGFDYGHSKVALTALAQYHALSIVYLSRIKTGDGRFNLPDRLRFVRGVAEFDRLVNDTLSNDVPHFMEYYRLNGFQEVRLVRDTIIGKS